MLGGVVVLVLIALVLIQRYRYLNDPLVVHKRLWDEREKLLFHREYYVQLWEESMSLTERSEIMARFIRPMNMRQDKIEAEMARIAPAVAARKKQKELERRQLQLRMRQQQRGSEKNEASYANIRVRGSHREGHELPVDRYDDLRTVHRRNRWPD